MARFLLRIWRSLRAEIVLGFLIATIFWIGILAWQTAYAPTHAEKQKCYEAAHNAGFNGEECESFWEQATSNPIAFFTLVLAVSTVGLWVATIFLYRAGERQFRHIRRSAIIQSRDMQASIKTATKGVNNEIAANQISVTNAQHQLRAYVTAKDITLVRRRKGGTRSASGDIIDGPVHTYELAAVLRNGGQTPAINTTINVSCAEQHIPLADDFAFPDSDMVGHGLIGPNSEVLSPPALVPRNHLRRKQRVRLGSFGDG